MEQHAHPSIAGQKLRVGKPLGRQTCFSGKHHLRSQALRCTGFLGLEGAAIAFLILVFGEKQHWRVGTGAPALFLFAEEGIFQQLHTEWLSRAIH